MNILIKGMDKPESCCACPLFRRGIGDISLCIALGKFMPVPEDSKEKLENCPLIEAPEPKHGKWIEYSEAFGFGGLQEHIVCSECLEVFYLVNNDTEKFNYCPNCGARMDGA